MYYRIYFNSEALFQIPVEETVVGKQTVSIAHVLVTQDTYYTLIRGTARMVGLYTSVVMIKPIVKHI